MKAFRGGHVVAEFLGAQRPTAVSAFLDQLTGPSAAEQLLSELEATGELPEIVAAARAGDHERAFEAILEGIAAAAGDDERRTKLRRLAVALFQELGRGARSACSTAVASRPRCTANEPPFRSAAARR